MSLTRAKTAGFLRDWSVPPRWPCAPPLSSQPRVGARWPPPSPRPSPQTRIGRASVSLSVAKLPLFLTHHTGVLQVWFMWPGMHLSFLRRVWAPCGCSWGLGFPFSGVHTLELLALPPRLHVVVGVCVAVLYILSHSGPAFNLLVCPSQDIQHFRKHA